MDYITVVKPVNASQGFELYLKSPYLKKVRATILHDWKSKPPSLDIHREILTKDMQWKALNGNLEEMLPFNFLPSVTIKPVKGGDIKPEDRFTELDDHPEIACSEADSET